MNIKNFLSKVMIMKEEKQVSDNLLGITRAKKSVNVLSVGMILLIFIALFLVIPSVHAEDEATGFEAMPRAMAEQVLNGPSSVINDMVLKTGEIGTFYNYVMGDTASAGERVVDGGFMKAFSSATIIIKIVAIALIIISLAVNNFIPNIFKEDKDITYELTRFGLEVALSAVLVIICDKIILIFAKMGEFLVSGITVNTTGMENAADKLLENLLGSAEGGFLWALKGFFLLMVPWLLSWVVYALIYFICIQTLLELGVRKLFAPMAIFGLFTEGWRSPGVRYFMKIFAIYVKLAMIKVISATVMLLVGLLQVTDDFNALNTRIAELALTNPRTKEQDQELHDLYMELGHKQLLVFENGGDVVTQGLSEFWNGLGATLNYLLKYLIVQFTGVGAMFKAGEIANEIGGTH